MKNKHPKYRVSQWLDTSPESMAKPEADIWYGVQTQREPRGPWMHVSINGTKQIFKTAAEAAACIQQCQEDNMPASPVTLAELRQHYV